MSVTTSACRLVRFLGAVVAVLAAAAAANAQPTFSKSFTPPTIGPGSVSTLRFDITNASGAPVDTMAFTDTLPGPVTIASPANVTTDCTIAPGGSLTAPDGGTTITLVDGAVAAMSACSITVDVTASATGMNTSGDLTSSAGNSGPASATLTVDPSTRPAFTKSFSPSPVPFGSRTTLTLTVDFTAGAGLVSFSFTDNLPPGMVIATPSNASTTNCSGTLTATPGTSVVALGFSSFFAGPAAICTVDVDVVAGPVGLVGNTTDEMTANGASAGKAAAVLDVTSSPIHIVKSFTDDPVAPGALGTLEFTIENRDRNFAATGIGFSDVLDASLAGVVAVAPLPATPCNGSGTLSGTSTLTLSGATLGAGGSCTFSVTVQVPPAALPGIYPNSAGPVSGTVSGSPVMGNTASDDLFVSPAPLLTKQFIGDPINAGGTVTLRFTVTNTSTTSAATAIAFVDELTTFLPFPLTLTPPGPDPCGAGSSVTNMHIGTDREGPALAGGILAAAPGAGSTCTFDVTLTVPAGVAPGVYVNTTEAITATVDGATRTGLPASDTLTVVAAPTLSKSFTDDPVAPGGTVTLEYTLSYPPDAAGDATAITFTDDLANDLVPALALTANLPPSPDPPCGAGSSLAGSAGNTFLTLNGGTLMPGTSCTFSVTLNVPAAAASGTYTNTTSIVDATVAATSTTSPSASDDLLVADLAFTKQFLGDPAIPGETVTLRFTIDNVSTTDATGIMFTDNLADVLPGATDLTATLPSTPDPPCGPGSSLTGLFGNTFLSFDIGVGTLLAGTMCTFDVDVLVPAGTADGVYSNTTSNLTSSVGTILPAIDDLTVDSALLALTKAFTDDPVAAGGTVTLEFTLTNLDPARAASGIAFTDDLGATLPGLVATSLPTVACGGGMADPIPDTGTIDFSGGSLAGGASCVFTVSLSVPAGATPGTIATNTTSPVTGTINALPVTGAPASDDLLIAGNLVFSKSFDGPTVAGGTPTLTFTIQNPGSLDVSGITLADDLSTVIPGLVSTSGTLSDVCGAGSSLSGTSILLLTGGNLLAGGSCMFSVNLLVPGAATPGSFLNTTTDLFASGIVFSAPATDSLIVTALPPFSKSFLPATIDVGDVSTLLFLIDNTAGTEDATGVAFTDNLPAGMVIATPGNAMNSCGGTLTATDGTAVVSLSGGTVLAGASCTIQVDVTSAAPGTHLNVSSPLSASLGGGAPVTGDAASAPAATLIVGSSLLLIPTLSTWGFVLFAGFLALVAVWKMRPRS